MSEPYDLQRFLDAQASVYAQALKELRAGRKSSHWMWFVFPQLRGLGRSDTAQFYGISGSAEAVAYLAQPELAGRLRECCEALLSLRGKSAEAVFGELDALKLHSSITLFARASHGDELFTAVLAHYFAGEEDAKTLELLES
ncbi:DUF1810 domain-containing protein [Pseudomonas sp. RIT-PI-S]|uniref:DUF1810 domain-containing protein n=1 Tax=Pseudomonas sp. RIT-PI-S TaxID=3035295 RepID=UPI0021D94BB9|nr:DUF1810 domain-containing protein [Pseudomonas sp. RIT-PI-S]